MRETIQYKTISNAILADFERKGYVPGTKLPPVRTIARDHEVSVFTVSKALKLLETKGIIERRWGVGCFLSRSSGRTVRPSKSATIGILLNPYRPVSDSWSNALLEATLAVIAENVAHPIYISWDNDLKIGRQCDALIVHSQLFEANSDRTVQMHSWIKAAITDEFPVVALDFDMPFLSSVQIDNLGSQAQAARYLLHLGHRDIAYAGIVGHRPSEERLAGLRLALIEVNKSHDDNLVWYTRPSVHTTYQMFAEFRKGRKFSAICCFEDGGAMGIIKAAKEMGLRVPGDLSVVGFGNLPLGAFAIQPLTTIDIRPRALAERAVQILLESLTEKNRAITKLQLPGELIVRESTGPHLVSGSLV
jgi:DNA-binding LacI/PurR family transcriptional regulator